MSHPDYYCGADRKAALAHAIQVSQQATYQGDGTMVVCYAELSTTGPPTVEFTWPENHVRHRADKNRWAVVDCVGVYTIKKGWATFHGYVTRDLIQPGMMDGVGWLKMPIANIAKTPPANKPCINIPATMGHIDTKAYFRGVPHERLFPKGVTLELVQRLIERRLELLLCHTKEGEEALAGSDAQSFVLMSECVIRCGRDDVYRWWMKAERRLYKDRVHALFRRESRAGIDVARWLDCKASDIDEKQTVEDMMLIGTAYVKVSWLACLPVMHLHPLMRDGMVYLTPELLRLHLTSSFGRWLSHPDTGFAPRLRNESSSRRWELLETQDVKLLPLEDRVMVGMARAIRRRLSPTDALVEPGAASVPKEIIKQVAKIGEGLGPSQRFLPPCVKSMIAHHRTEYHTSGGHDFRYVMSRLLRHGGYNKGQMVSFLVRPSGMEQARCKKLANEIERFFVDKDGVPTKLYGCSSCDTMLKLGYCPVKQRCVVAGKSVHNPAEYIRRRVEIAIEEDKQPKSAAAAVPMSVEQ